MEIKNNTKYRNKITGELYISGKEADKGKFVFLYCTDKDGNKLIGSSDIVRKDAFEEDFEEVGE